MNLPNTNFGRPTSDKKIKVHINDEENTMLYSPADYTGNRWFGTWNKLIHMPVNLNHEAREKYYNVWNAKIKAELEIESIPKCFSECAASDMSEALTSEEKNCMRECYFKRVTSKDDYHSIIQQKLGVETAKGMRERHV